MTDIRKKQKRIKRVRAKILHKSALPRLSVFRSNKYIYAQIIDDQTGKTLVVASSLKEKKTKDYMSLSKDIGKKLAEEALKQKITHVVFDRGSYKYHGKIKALAEGAREGGLKF